MFDREQEDKKAGHPTEERKENLAKNSTIAG